MKFSFTTSGSLRFLQSNLHICIKVPVCKHEGVKKFPHRQRLETKKSLKGLSILLARGEQQTNLLSADSQEFSSEWLPPFAFYLVSHTHIQSSTIFHVPRPGIYHEYAVIDLFGQCEDNDQSEDNIPLLKHSSLCLTSSPCEFLIYDGLSGLDIYAVTICRLFRQRDVFIWSQKHQLVYFNNKLLFCIDLNKHLIDRAQSHSPLLSI